MILFLPLEEFHDAMKEGYTRYVAELSKKEPEEAAAHPPFEQMAPDDFAVFQACVEGVLDSLGIFVQQVVTIEPQREAAPLSQELGEDSV